MTLARRGSKTLAIAGSDPATGGSSLQQAAVAVMGLLQPLAASKPCSQPCSQPCSHYPSPHAGYTPKLHRTPLSAPLPPLSPQAYAQRSVPVGTAALAYSLEPCFAAALAAVFLHEEPSGAQAVGGALIVAANLLA